MELNSQKMGYIASLGAPEAYESSLSGEGEYANDSEVAAAIAAAREAHQADIQRREHWLAEYQDALRYREDLAERQRLEKYIRVGRAIIEAMRQEDGEDRAIHLIADILRTRAEQRVIEQMQCFYNENEEVLHSDGA